LDLSTTATRRRHRFFCFFIEQSNEASRPHVIVLTLGGLPAPAELVRRGPCLFGISECGRDAKYADDGSMLPGGLPCLEEGAEVLEHPSPDDTASPLPTSPDTKSAGSDGIKIANEALPFEPLVPNKEAMEAMKAARRGELVTVG
jgi:hypothetical protein